VLDRYDSYWGGRAKASGIDVTRIGDGTARANALHGVDIAEWIPAAQVKLLTTRPARSWTKGGALRRATCANRAELPEAATVLQQQLEKGVLSGSRLQQPSRAGRPDRSGSSSKGW
jgi:hypothetical protein